MKRRNSDADEIMAAMADSLGITKTASPISMEWFKNELVKAENKRDLNRLNKLKELSARVAINPERAFSLAVKAIQRCSKRK